MVLGQETRSNKHTPAIAFYPALLPSLFHRATEDTTTGAADTMTATVGATTAVGATGATEAENRVGPSGAGCWQS